jgi:hypothetical protein
MQITEYEDINQILQILLSRIKAVLGDKLVGLYLGGSLVLGDFEAGISDIDLLAALSSPVEDNELAALEKMHTDFVAEYPEWYDRIEICYASLQTLKTVKSTTSTVVNISPGEPIHRRQTTKEWLMSWYLIREQSKTLYGPPPQTVIEPISHQEFIQAVKDHATGWGDWVQQMRNPFAQSYAILAISRAFYSIRTGEQTSKKQAALWVEQQLPQWSQVIHNALVWRSGGKYLPADELTHPKTVEFVNFVRALILTQ